MKNFRTQFFLLFVAITVVSCTSSAPDIWVDNDSYYALSGGGDAQLMKSNDLKNWTHLGSLLHPDFPKDLGVDKQTDISCANMFKIGNKWMLLCISHTMGCRYYLGDFIDEQYLPNFHGFMNWKKQGDMGSYFAPESFLTKDGRRVMQAWLRLGTRPANLQSLPRELSLPEDGVQVKEVKSWKMKTIYK